ncbi:MAG: hypothetical protein COV75_08590 [Candidatus Omnitrophica bacterium CG11_big_fil_rev_8_21_14_0_20_63_9]|nr:MAG: hypothetical protein COV75_08590 [Candidatus Omnitrophica bacterium CG11_big_fil_rev_8_21_14_0_20_63_9]
MRIVHFTSHLNIGGVSRHVLALAFAMRRRGHHVTLVSGGGELVKSLQGTGIEHWHAPLHTSVEFSPQVWRAAFHLAARLAQQPADILHAHTRVGQLVAHRLSRRLKIPYVATWHGFFRPNPGRWLWPCTGRLTIAVSEPVRQHLETAFRVPAGRIRLIPNGVDVEHFAQPPEPSSLEAARARWSLPTGCPVVGSMGRLASGGVKGFDILLAAVQRLKADLPSVQVLIVGEGPRREFLEQETTRLQLRECVHFAGAVEDVRVPLALMDVFAFPVRWQEGFGLALIEAMAAGKPAVASRTGAAPSIIENDSTGRLVPVEDVQALAGALRQLLQDPATAQRLGRAGQQRVRQAFSLERMADQVEAVYRELVPAA